MLGLGELHVVPDVDSIIPFSKWYYLRTSGTTLQHSNTPSLQHFGPGYTGVGVGVPLKTSFLERYHALIGFGVSMVARGALPFLGTMCAVLTNRLVRNIDL